MERQTQTTNTNKAVGILQPMATHPASCAQRHRGRSNGPRTRKIEDVACKRHRRRQRATRNGTGTGTKDSRAIEARSRQQNKKHKPHERQPSDRGTIETEKQKTQTSRRTSRFLFLSCSSCGRLSVGGGWLLG